MYLMVSPHTSLQVVQGNHVCEKNRITTNDVARSEELRTCGELEHLSYQSELIVLRLLTETDPCRARALLVSGKDETATA